MKFIVAVDMEGIACAYGPFGSGVEDSFNIASVRKQASKEANAAATALFDCGAEEVIVWDNHSRGCSLDYEELDERCKIAIGSTVYTRYPGLDESFTGVVLVGYHAMEGTADAVLAHTYSGVRFQHVKANGKCYGEIGLDAAIAGDLGVPVIFVSSDNKGCAEAKDIMPWVETVETKQSFAFTRVVSKHPRAVVKEIHAGVKKAVERLPEMKPYKIERPVTLEIRYKRLDEAQHARNIDKDGKPFDFADSFTRVGVLEKAEDIIFRL